MWEESTGKQILQSISLEILERSENGYVIVDPAGDIMYCNESFLRYIGLPAKDLLMRNIRSVLRETQILEVMKSGQSTIDNIGVVRRHIPLGERADSNIHLVSRYAIPDSSGCIIGGVFCVKFRKPLLAATKQLYSAHTDLDLFYEKAPLPSGAYGETVIGQSPSFVKVKNMALRASNTDFPVLITGETGTGKEVIANLIHYSNHRAGKPFIKINCASIPNELLESELFGYEPGAFTGASKSGKKGKFELADGGTIFLDEIGDMPLNMQVKLLRVLQEKEIEHVGGSQSIPIDVRVISATRQNLPEMIERKEFREDLFYRLNVINIRMPALRERKEDILPLADYFLNDLNASYGTQITLPYVFNEALINYPWPGNIRELNNVIQSAYALTDGIELNLDTFSARYKSKKHQKVRESGRPLDEMVEQFEKAIIIDMIIECHSNLSVVAARLDIPRSSLYNKLKRYEIDLQKLKPPEQ